MFYYIEGVLSLVSANSAVIDCCGIGFFLNCSSTTLTSVKSGEKTRMYIYSVIREDCFDLYGFYSLAEKQCFEMLIGISGIGPKAAQAILSYNTPEMLHTAVISENEKAFVSIPGIGKKTAQRIILELKDKISKANETATFDTVVLSGDDLSAEVMDKGKISDVISALIALGYNNSDAVSAIKGIDIASMSTENAIKTALRNML